MSLEEQLENAEPGDIIEFAGRVRLGKVIGVRGTAAAPITLRGRDDSAVLVPSPDYLYAVARLEQSAHVRLEHFKIDGEGRAERGIQIFTSQFINLDWIETERLKFDHVHLAGSNDCTVRHLRANGAGGQELRDGVGPHAIYVTRVDSGGDVYRHVWEDCECVNIAGSAWQANGDGRVVHNLFARRMKATDWGEYGGALFNLAAVDDAQLEDIWGETRFDSGGVRSFDGSRGVTLNRYHITNPDGEVTDGPVAIISSGPPAPPDFGETAPPVEPPVEPPTEDLAAEVARLEAELAAVDAWVMTYPRA